jgi:hypothetical protein
MSVKDHVEIKIFLARLSFYRGEKREYHAENPDTTGFSIPFP